VTAKSVEFELNSSPLFKNEWESIAGGGTHAVSQPCEFEIHERRGVAQRGPKQKAKSICAIRRPGRVKEDGKKET